MSGKISPNWSRLRIIGSAKKGGYLFKKSRGIKPSGVISKTIFWKSVSMSWDRMNGSLLVKHLWPKCRKFVIARRGFLFKGMPSSVGRDGLLLSIQVLTRGSGLWGRNIYCWFCGSPREVSGERLQLWLKGGQRVKLKIDLIWYWEGKGSL